MTASDRSDALEVTGTSGSSTGRGWSRIATGAFTVIAVIGILGLTGDGSPG